MKATDSMTTTQKIALVTGASRGIGAAAARGFAAAGCRLALHYHTEPHEAGLVPGAVLLQGDCARTADVRRVVEDALTALGGLDVESQRGRRQWLRGRRRRSCRGGSGRGGWRSRRISPGGWGRR